MFPIARSFCFETATRDRADSRRRADAAASVSLLAVSRLQKMQVMNRTAAPRIVPTVVALALSLAALGCRNAPDPAFTQLAEARRLADDLRVAAGQDLERLRSRRHGRHRRGVGRVRPPGRSGGGHASRARRRRSRRGCRASATPPSCARCRTSRIASPPTGSSTTTSSTSRSRTPTSRRSASRSVPSARRPTRYRDALQSAAQLAPAKDRCRVDALVARAELAVREIQILQAPHIAEPDETAMTKIENQMTERLAAARDALKSLGAAQRRDGASSSTRPARRSIASTSSRPSWSRSRAATATFARWRWRSAARRSWWPPATEAWRASRRRSAKEGFSGTR